MLSTQPLPGYRPSRTAPRRHSLGRRTLRCMEGVSLWLAMLMLLFVQPLFAEASERRVAAVSGTFHPVNECRRDTVPARSIGVPVRQDRRA
ncbi:MAG: hypothetical protein ACOCVV_12230 [Marinobacter sp.]